MTNKTGKSDTKGAPVSGKPPSQSRQLSASTPTRLQRWAFRLVAGIVIPALFFGLFEAGLRIGAYGYPTNFFRKIEGRDGFTVNPRFVWRFFPRTLPLRQPPVIALPAVKGEKVYRIFNLGGSAAMGVPDQSFGFGRILRVMLEETYPGRRFEVVNAAMTAISSHVVLPVTRDCARHAPDLFVVYLGNNEVSGPFGAAEFFQTSSPSLWTIRTSLWLKTTRLGQLIGDLARWFGGRDGPVEWGGLEMFLKHRLASDDPRLERTYRHFRRNLEDICSVGTGAGAEVILCTVATNLKDCPPFASAHRTGLKDAELGQWNRAYQAGGRLEQAGNWEPARAQYLAAAAIDDRYSELHFRLGRCYLATSRIEEARASFVKARDLDTLRVRADSRLNDIIRQVAAARDGQGVYLVDAERAPAESGDTLAHLPGEALFYDHVHLTFPGAYRLARAVFRQVVRRLPEAVRSKDPQPPSLARSAQRLVLTPWQQRQMLRQISMLTDRPPFTLQLGHAQRQAARREQLRRLESQMTPEAAEEARQRYRQALARAEDDELLRTNFARFLLGRRERAGAEEQFRVALRDLPNDPARHFDLAQCLFAQGKEAEADRHFARAMALSAEKAELCERTAAFFLSRRRIDQAADLCRKSLELRPNHPKTLRTMGLIHLARREWGPAITNLSEALQRRPNDARLHQELGLALANSGRIAQAMERLHWAVELAPRLTRARIYYARLLSAQRRFAEAVAQYHAILAYEPDSLPVMNDLARILATCDDPKVRDVSKAVEVAERAAELTDRKHPGILDALALAHAEAGRFDRALEIARQALDLATGTGNTRLATRLRGQIALYRAGKVR